jgi:hypothetical protein
LGAHERRVVCRAGARVVSDELEQLNSSISLAQRVERLLEDAHLVGVRWDGRHVDDGFCGRRGERGRDGAHDASERGVFALRLPLGVPVVRTGNAEAFAVERNDAEGQVIGLESLSSIHSSYANSL